MISSHLKLSDSKFIRYFKSFVLLRGKHIGFYGNFGHGDLGDDAAFFAANGLFDGTLLPVSKRAYVFNPGVLKALLIGGGLLRWESPYLPSKLLLGGKCDFPVIVYSAGVNCDYGREFTQEAKEQVQKLCRLASYIGVRDELSRVFLKGLGINNTSLVPDLELLLEESRPGTAYQKQGKTVGIVLSPHSEFDDKTLYKIITVFADLCNYLIGKGYNIVILPFDGQGSENKREAMLIKEIFEKIKAPQQVKIFDNNLSPQELLYVIKNYCDMMFCMRLHGCVFAANAGVPFVCVGFNQMHKGFMELLARGNLEVSLFNGFSAEKLTERFEHLEKNYAEIKNSLIVKRDILRQQIKDETQKIKGLLNNA